MLQTHDFYDHRDHTEGFLPPLWLTISRASARTHTQTYTPGMCYPARGGFKEKGLVSHKSRGPPSFPLSFPSPPLPSPPFPLSLPSTPPFPLLPFLPLLSPPFPLSLLSPPLRSRSPFLRLGGLGERLSSPSGSGQSPAAKRILVHFDLKIKASGGNNFTDFPKNQLTKFRAKC